MMHRRILPFLIVSTMLLGCSSPAIDAPDDPLIATQEPTAEIGETPTSTVEASNTPFQQAFPGPSTLVPTITPTYNAAQIATRQAIIAEAQRLATINAATPASELRSENNIWDFGEQGYSYIYEGNVCLNMTGTPVYLGEAANEIDMIPPSPNGLYIAYQLVHSNETFDAFRSEVRIARTDGSQNIIAFTTEKVLADYPAAGEHFTNMRWMPSSTQLLFSTFSGWGGHRIPQGDLYRYDAATPELVALIPPSHTVDYATLNYALSPDGQWIAVDDGSSLSFMRSDGGVYREDVFQYQWVRLECDSAEFPFDLIWKPDSSGVTFAVHGWVPSNPTDESNADATVSSWFVPVAGEPQKLGEFSSEVFPSGPCTTWGTTAVSPAHQWIAYAFRGDVLGIIRVDGSQNITLVEDAGPRQRFEWLDNNTVRFALADNSPLGGNRVLYDWRYYTAILDGTVTPVDGPTLPDNPLISCAP